MSDRIAVEILQKAIADSERTKSEICRDMGWTREIADLDRLNRQMGLKSYNCSRGGMRRAHATTSYEAAVDIINAAGLDPVDYGL